MKKILTIFASFIMMFSLVACGGPSPSDVTDAFLKGIKEQDKEAIAGSYADDEIDILGDVADAGESDNSPMTKVVDEKMLPKMLEFDYEILGEEIEGDKAMVEVSIKTYEFGAAFTAFAEEFITQAFDLYFADASDEQVEEAGAKILIDELDKLKEKKYEKTVKIGLTKEDGQWVIDEMDEDDSLINAVSGGLYDALNAMEAMF